MSSGDLADPYTGLQVHYVRGGASEVDIDHVVAEADAWRTGARAGLWRDGPPWPTIR